MRPRIGIIGGGNIGGTHSRCAHYLIKQGLIDAELVGICEADPVRRDSFAEAARMPFRTDDPAELIAHPDINTVYVCTPTVSHRALVEQVAAAGKALFCEKPLAFNAADARAMRDAVHAAGITHQVGLVMRFSPVVNVTRDLSREPASGRVMTAVIVDEQFFPIQGHYASTWRGDVTQVGAGTLLEHAIHDIDVLVFTFGRVKRVFGTTRFFAEKPGVEDLSSAIIEFESGAVANHTSIWHNILSRRSTRRMSVFCENAEYAWQDDESVGAIQVESNDTNGRTEIPPEEVLRRYVEGGGIPAGAGEQMQLLRGGLEYVHENHAFLRAVTEGRAASPDFDAAVYAHEIVDAIYESARTGQPVELSS